MISYEAYKVMHLTGIALLLLGLGILLGAFASTKTVSAKIRMAGFLGHGFGLLLIITGGFGMAARLGLTSGLPGWIYAKLLIWVLFGLGVSLAKRKATMPVALLLLFTILLSAAAGIAIWKPSFGSDTNQPVSVR